MFCEAYKKKVYGDRFQWLIVGMYEATWWDRDHTNLDCTPSQVGTVNILFILTGGHCELSVNPYRRAL